MGKQMEFCLGRPIQGGVAIGRIRVFQRREDQIRRRDIQDTQAEIARVEMAREEASRQLDALYRETCESAGRAQASIFLAHKMLLEDEAYLESIYGMIRKERVNAEYAVTVSGILFSDTFAAMEDARMRARSADVRDVSGRLVRLMEGAKEEPLKAGPPAILLAEDLSPSETVRLKTEGLLALVLQKGAAGSHTAILARALDIPALVQTEIKPPLARYDGMLAVVDAQSGRLILEPDKELLSQMEEKKRRLEREREDLRFWIGKENVSAGGRRMEILANIGSLEELGQAVENDAGGIGLMRTEFLFLGRDTYPAEEEQVAAYREAIGSMPGKPVIIRTLDLGADKQESYLGLPREENPALGCRAIRLCFQRQEMFRTQLRAICRAAAQGSCSILLPLIVSVEEIRLVRQLLAEVGAELQKRAIPYAIPSVGAMIETPAAALISAELAREVDFFSIGTNDLAQYTLAADRQNPGLEGMYSRSHPAVWRLIQMTVENGHKAGIPVSICGELASDPGLVRTFLDLGVDALSVVPASVLPLRRALWSA